MIVFYVLWKLNWESGIGKIHSIHIHDDYSLVIIVQTNREKRNQFTRNLLCDSLVEISDCPEMGIEFIRKTGIAVIGHTLIVMIEQTVA